MIIPSVVTLGNNQQLPSESPTPSSPALGPSNLLVSEALEPANAQRGLCSKRYSTKKEDKVEVEDPEKADNSKMQDILIGIAEGKPSVRKDLLEVKVRPRRTVETHFDASDNIASTSTENLEDKMTNAKGFCDGFAVASTSHSETMARPILKRL